MAMLPHSGSHVSLSYPNISSVKGLPIGLETIWYHGKDPVLALVSSIGRHGVIQTKYIFLG